MTKHDVGIIIGALLVASATPGWGHKLFMVIGIAMLIYNWGRN